MVRVVGSAFCLVLVVLSSCCLIFIDTSTHIAT